MQGRKSTHRETDDVRFVDLQGVQHGLDVVARALLRVFLYIVRYVGRREPARVVGDAAIAAPEITHLGFPRAAIAGELVNKDERDAAPDLLVVELHAVVGGQMRHCTSPQPD